MLHIKKSFKKKKCKKGIKYNSSATCGCIRGIVISLYDTLGLQMNYYLLHLALRGKFLEQKTCQMLVDKISLRPGNGFQDE